MDYEKKYNEAMNDMRVIYPNLKGDAKLAVEHAFPELRESEDERIRKALVWHLKADVDFVSNGVTKAECIAYLEKQKEQKPAEWSEEDEKIISNIRHLLFGLAFENGGVDVNGDYCKDVYIQADDFLKSLRPSWKPSEEQMEELNKARTLNPGLDALYQQLKNM